MRFFRRKSIRRDDGAAGKLNAMVLRYQRKWADFLNARFRDLSLKARVFGLILFCAVCSSYLLYLLFSSIR